MSTAITITQGFSADQDLPKVPKDTIILRDSLRNRLFASPLLLSPGQPKINGVSSAVQILHRRGQDNTIISPTNSSRQQQQQYNNLTNTQGNSILREPNTTNTTTTTTTTTTSSSSVKPGQFPQRNASSNALKNLFVMSSLQQSEAQFQSVQALLRIKREVRQAEEQQQLQNRKRGGSCYDPKQQLMSLNNESNNSQQHHHQQLMMLQKNHSQPSLIEVNDTKNGFSERTPFVLDQNFIAGGDANKPTNSPDLITLKANTNRSISSNYNTNNNSHSPFISTSTLATTRLLTQRTFPIKSLSKLPLNSLINAENQASFRNTESRSNSRGRQISMPASSGSGLSFSTTKDNFRKVITSNVTVKGTESNLRNSNANINGSLNNSNLNNQKQLIIFTQNQQGVDKITNKVTPSAGASNTTNNNNNNSNTATSQHTANNDSPLQVKHQISRQGNQIILRARTPNRTINNSNITNAAFILNSSNINTNTNTTIATYQNLPMKNHQILPSNVIINLSQNNNTSMSSSQLINLIGQQSIRKQQQTAVPAVVSIESYEFEDIIGKGSYAVVKLAKDKRTQLPVAIKIYEKFKLADPNKFKNIRREINILSKMNHPNVIQLYHIIDTVSTLNLVMEYIGRSSLFNFLRSKRKNQLPISLVKQIFKEIIQGIAYLHSKSVCHRDIKLENILIKESDENSTLLIKIIDFGFAVYAPAGRMISTYCGTPSYMAPEVIAKKEYSGQPADIWSAGILLYILICGKFPFKGIDENDLFRRIKQGVYETPQFAEPDVRSLITRMLMSNPEQRPTCKEVLNDVWLQS